MTARRHSRKERVPETLPLHLTKMVSATSDLSCNIHVIAIPSVIMFSLKRICLLSLHQTDGHRNIANLDMPGGSVEPFFMAVFTGFDQLQE